MTHQPTRLNLDEIEARANAATPGPWCTDSWEIYQGSKYQAGAEWIGETCRTGEMDDGRADAEFVAAARTDVPALLAEVRRLRADLEAVTEFRLTPAPPAYTPIIVRRDPTYDGTRWAVLHDPGDLAVRRAWTPDGWEMAWASTRDEIFCWSDAASALAAARQAQADDDREPDVDGVGRTPESYQSAPAAAGVAGGPR